MNFWDKCWAVCVLGWSFLRRVVPATILIALTIATYTLFQTNISRPDAAWAYVEPGIRKAYSDRANACGVTWMGLLKNETACKVLNQGDPKGMEVAQKSAFPKLEDYLAAARAVSTLRSPALPQSPKAKTSVKPVIKAKISKGRKRRKETSLQQLLTFARSHHYRVTSTTGGRHHRGSKHYKGKAIDIDHRGVNAKKLLKLAAAKGFRVLDERRRPRGQRVWSGPHFHIETRG